MLKPLGKNILVRKLKEPEKRGALILTEDANVPFRARVLDMGGKVELEINLQDVLLMVPYCGARIDALDDELMLVTEKDILGIVSEAYP